MPIRLKRSNSFGDRRAGVLLAGAIVAGTLWAQVPAPALQPPSILDYIQRTWKVLTRSNKDMAKATVDHPVAGCTARHDTKPGIDPECPQ